MIEARYAYARVTFSGQSTSGQPVEAIVGVELDPTLLPSVAYEGVRAGIGGRVDIRKLLETGDDVVIAAALEIEIKECWPGASYFIEVGRGLLNEWVQVFEPKAHSA